jgi:hypothetical protein
VDLSDSALDYRSIIKNSNGTVTRFCGFNPESSRIPTGKASNCPKIQKIFCN